MVLMDTGSQTGSISISFGGFPMRLLSSQLVLVTTIAFVDPDQSRGTPIWTNGMKWSDRGAVRDLMGDLKQRIERQEH